MVNRNRSTLKCRLCVPEAFKKFSCKYGYDVIAAAMLDRHCGWRVEKGYSKCGLVQTSAQGRECDTMVHCYKGSVCS